MHIPPYTPEMNPIEQIRKQIRTTGLKKEIFNSLSDVEDRLCQTINKLSKKIIKRITHRDRIIDAYLNKYQYKNNIANIIRNFEIHNLKNLKS